MSKNLRVFFLSVMVVLLAMSSAMAAEIMMVSGDDTAHIPPYYTFKADGGSVDITIYHDGEYTFESGDIAKISFDESKYTTVRNVTIGLPAPKPDKAGNGTGGAWEIKYPTGLGTSDRFNLTIQKSNNTTHAAITSSSIKFEVPQYVNLTVNVPFRVHDGYTETELTSMDFQLKVSPDAVFTFGPEARIYGNSADVLNPTGFVGGSKASYDIIAGGKVVVQNEWALRGSGLTVDVKYIDDKNYGTLLIEIPETTLDLRGKGETTKGATINANGYISVNKALTLIGELHATSHDIHKGGTGTLTLAQDSAWPAPALSADIGNVYVMNGGLVLSGKPTWITSKGGAGVVVSNDATFTANEKSIEEGGKSFDIQVRGTSTATFKQHAIYKGSEIYPYDKYLYKDNGLTINVEGVAVDVEKNAKLVIDGGSFALSTLTGEGTVTMSGSTEEEPDRVVLIFTSADVSNSSDLNFEGTLEGNIGFYATSPVSYDAQMFASGDFSGIDNILVYGPSLLAIDDKTYEYIKDTKNIWLRGHRPGAANYKDDGTLDSNMATSGLTVGGLILGNSVSFDENSKDAVIEMSTNLKIDGTSNAAKKALIKLDKGVYATLGTIEFFANKSGDFKGTYAAPANGVCVLTIDGTAQPSKLIIDGSLVTGEGVASDLTATEPVYQVEITKSSDVRFLGNNGDVHHPIAKNTSLLVGQDGKVEMGRGAVIDGHLTFKGSTKAVASEYSAVESLDYPQEAWFASDDNRWNLVSLDGYSVFTTVVAKNNRVNGSVSADASEYAVKVGGNITFSRDVEVTPGLSSYPGRVLVRTKANTNAFDGVQLTTLQRFRVVGTTDSSSEYTPDFVTVYNPTYLWRVTPQGDLNAKGVVIENRKEFALLSMGDFTFTKGADTFGNGEFSAQSEVTAWAKGDKLTIEAGTSQDKYVLRRGNDIYHVTKAQVFFRQNVEGEEISMSNIFDEEAWSTTFSSNDVLMNGAFRINADGTPVVEFTGYSYGGYKFVDVTVMLAFEGYDGTMEIAGVIPAYKIAPFSPSGLGDKFSKAETYANEPFSFIDGNNGIVSFTVVGMQKSAASTTSSYELVNGVYTWNVKAVEGAYLLPDENGSYARIENLRLIRYNGTNYSDATPVTVEENPVLTPEGNTMIVSAASSALGDTGDAFVATKWLALRGDTSDGTLTTNPVAYTLFKATSPDNIITGKGTLDQTVLIGGDSVSGQYEVTVNDGFSGDITLQPVNLPSWLGYNGGGGMISYQTGDLTGVKPGVHTFQVVAYDKEGNHKIYQFTVTVTGELAPVVPHIEPEEETTTVNVVTGETQTVTLTFVSGDATTVTWSFTPEGIPGLLTGVANGNTYTLTVNANGVEPGSYSYVISVNDGAYTRNLTVVVTAATFEIADEPNDATYEGYNYRNVITAAGAAGKVTWTVTPARAADTWLKLVESGDAQLILAGVLPDYDDGEDADNDHVFTMTASVGTVYAENATTEAPYEITVTVEEDTMLPVSAPADIVSPASGVSLGSADKNYSVTVTFPTDPEEEGTVVKSDYILDENGINLPDWLSYEVLSRDDNGDILGLRIVSKTVPGFANGTKGTVRIPADGVTLGWDVVYNAANPLVITAATATVSFDSPTAAAKTVKLSATDAIGAVTYTAAVDKAGLTAAVSGDVLTLTPSAAGTYVVTVTGKTATQTATATVNVTVSNGSAPSDFSISANPDTLTFTSPTAAAQTVKLSTNFLGATVTYTASVDKAGLTAAVSGDVLTLTPSAAGTYVVTVTGTNGERTATATVNVTVSNGSAPADFSISANPSTLTFTSPTAAAQTVTLSTNFLGATVTYTAAVTTGSETGLYLEVSGSTLTVDPLAAGTYVVTVTGTNGERTATATVNVTVRDGSTPSSFSISASPSTLTFTSPSAADQTVELSANIVGATVTYTAAVTTGSEAGLDLEVSGNTLTVDPLAAGTYVVTVTGTNGTDTATTTVSVTVGNAVRVGSSGGGCDAGFGALALLLAAPLFLRRRRS